MVENKPSRLVFLCSGGGGNLAFVQQVIAAGRLPGASIVAIITDRPCQANQFADHAGIANHCIDFKANDQAPLQALLDELQPDLIITTVHKIIGPAITQQYQGRMINLHYSLLPAFAGLIGVRPVQAALNHGCAFTGVTVHRVDATLDGGPPLVQGVIAIAPEDTLEPLMQVVFRSGCIALLSALNKLLGSSTAASAVHSQLIRGHSCLFNGGPGVDPTLANDEAFWQTLRQLLDAPSP